MRAAAEGSAFLLLLRSLRLCVSALSAFFNFLTITEFYTCYFLSTFLSPLVTRHSPLLPYDQLRHLPRTLPPPLLRLLRLASHRHHPRSARAASISTSPATTGAASAAAHSGTSPKSISSPAPAFPCRNPSFPHQAPPLIPPRASHKEEPKPKEEVKTDATPNSTNSRKNKPPPPSKPSKVFENQTPPAPTTPFPTARAAR